MAVIRATLDYIEAGFSKLEDLCIWYKPGSDFIKTEWQVDSTYLNEV